MAEKEAHPCDNEGAQELIDLPERAGESCVHSGNGGVAGHVGNLQASNLILGQLQHSMDVDTISRSIDGSDVIEEPVEQLPPEAQADGSIVDVEGEVLLRLEVQVGKWQLQVHHLDLADVVVELPLLPVQV